MGRYCAVHRKGSMLFALEPLHLTLLAAELLEDVVTVTWDGTGLDGKQVEVTVWDTDSETFVLRAFPVNAWGKIYLFTDWVQPPGIYDIQIWYNGVPDPVFAELVT